MKLLDRIFRKYRQPKTYKDVWEYLYWNESGTKEEFIKLWGEKKYRTFLNLGYIIE